MTPARVVLLAARESVAEFLIGLALFGLLIFVGGLTAAAVSLATQAALAYQARREPLRERVRAFAFWSMTVNLAVLAFGAWQRCPGAFALTC